MALSAFDCLRRGILNLRANWELVGVQWLQTLVVVTLIVVGLLPPIVVWTFQSGQSLAGISDTEISREQLLDLLETGAEGLVPLLLALLVTLGIWMLAFVIYCYLLGGTYGTLVAADRQAAPGQSRGWYPFRVFSLAQFRGWASAYIWRYFWFLNLFVAVAMVWVVLLVAIFGIATFANQTWGFPAALGIGCGGSLVIGFLFFIATLWAALGLADLGRKVSGVWSASRRALEILGRRLGATLLVWVALVVASFAGAFFFVPLNLVLDLALRESFIARMITKILLTLLQWLWTGILNVVFAGALVSLVRSETILGEPT